MEQILKNKAFQNAKWLILCKIFKGLLQVLMGALSARYLGPSNLGLVSYATSVVLFATPLMQLGLQMTLIQEYIEWPEKEGEILGTSLIMNLVSAVACIGLIACFAVVANHGDTEAIVICVLAGTSLIFQAVEMVQYWFQAKLLSKYSSLSTLLAYVIASAYKIYLLATGKNIFWFALSSTVEFAVIGIFHMLLYHRLGGQKLCCSAARAGRMFAKSKYYIVAILMVTVYQNTDQLMLKLMIGDAANGFYTTAATCANLTMFVFSAIMDSGRPSVLESHKASQEEFEKKMSAQYALIIYLALAQSVFMTISADFIVKILYGDAYQPSAFVLRILCWNMAFGCMGSMRNTWILAEGKHSVLWVINLSGALMNIFLNAVMIPLWEAPGAALASLLTQIFTNVVMGFVLKPIRPNNRLMLKGLNPKRIRDLIADMEKEA